MLKAVTGIVTAVHAKSCNSNGHKLYKLKAVTEMVTNVHVCLKLQLKLSQLYMLTTVVSMLISKSCN